MPIEWVVNLGYILLVVGICCWSSHSIDIAHEKKKVKAMKAKVRMMRRAV